jgi:hypothetical protein
MTIYSGAPLVQAKQTNPWAIWAFVLSLVGVVPFVGLITTILGITFGFVARGQISRTGGVQEGNGLALAAIIIGFVLIAAWVLVIVAGVLAGSQHTVN